MEPRYTPEGVEERWQKAWEEEGLYNADPDPSRESFAIAHPPPNVTGDLHLGHALQLSLADTIVRTKRMQGYNVLFQPGYDHAGISTQNAVEKHLAAKGESRQDLGREAFVELVWEWLREYGGKIMFQFRRIGASLDYRRERFTMDDAYIRAVMRFFVHLWEKGWIYRANRIVNWCPFHLTSLSDLELAHVEVDDALTLRPLSAGRRRGAHHDRDRAAGDDPRRRRGRRPSRRRALPGARRPRGRRAVGRAPRAGDRRRARRARLRHRRAEGDARPRREGLRDRPRPRPARADRDRPGRADERRGRARARRADAGGGRRADPRRGCASATSSRSASRTGTRSRSATAARRGSSR